MATEDLILPILRAMREENEARHRDVVARLDRLEERQKSFSQALSGDSLMSKLVTGDFEQRIEAMERFVKGIGGRAS